MDEWETDALDASSGDEARPGDIAGVAQSAADVIAAAQRRVRRRELAPVDHSATAYPPFVKDLYVASPDVAAMTPADVAALRARLDGLCVRPADCPAPVTRWAQCGLPPEVYDPLHGHALCDGTFHSIVSDQCMSCPLNAEPPCDCRLRNDADTQPRAH